MKFARSHSYIDHIAGNGVHNALAVNFRADDVSGRNHRRGRAGNQNLIISLKRRIGTQLNILTVTKYALNRRAASDLTLYFGDGSPCSTSNLVCTRLKLSIDEIIGFG